MIAIPDLQLGFRDAENYRRKENKELFNRIFVRTQELDRVCAPGTFFVVGEKGTGKTAYAIYLANNNYENIFASLRYIRETEYQKFVEMKRSRHLTLSDYTNIWKIIIYLLIAEQITAREGNNSFWNKFDKFRNLKAAIDEYYKNAFSPEIIYAIQFAEESEISAQLISKYANVGGKDKTKLSFSKNQFQTNLFYIQRQFEDALRSLKLEHNHLVFIDGIDIRPGSIPYEDYSECIKGLANAVWSVNNDFFSTIKDSKGRLRAVLLLRPDILDSIGLQNQNSKLRDNSVVLNWLTTYKDQRESALFHMADRLLAFQQDGLDDVGKAWDYYFPFDDTKLKSPQEGLSSFVLVLRNAMYRPRDVLAILGILKDNFIEQKRGKNSLFSQKDFTDPMFTRKYSDYLLGEVKDQLSFYYPAADWEKFVNFFHYLQGHSRFTYDQYLDSYNHYMTFLQRNNEKIPTFSVTADKFLQFLYDLNVISYIVETEDNERFFGFCFRERTTTNIAPKVRTGVRYEIHYGLMKALDLGKKFKRA
jgi:hypothetical protein